MKSIHEEFGINVKNIRIKMKLTQDELADKASIDRKTISYIENGNGNPELITINLLATALEVKTYELFIFDEEHEEEE